MLGRLEMHVDECIDAYTGMFKKIFGRRRLPVNILGRIKGRFDSIVLEECVKDILEQRGLPIIEPFNDEKDRACKVLVAPWYTGTVIEMLADQFTGWSVQKLPRSRAQSYCDPTSHTTLSTIFRPQFAKQFEQHLLQQASSIQPQSVHAGGNS
jgi:hypothetical protein